MDAIEKALNALDQAAQRKQQEWNELSDNISAVEDRISLLKFNIDHSITIAHDILEIPNASELCFSHLEEHNCYPEEINLHEEWNLEWKYSEVHKRNRLYLVCNSYFEFKSKTIGNHFWGGRNWSKFFSETNLKLRIRFVPFLGEFLNSFTQSLLK